MDVSFDIRICFGFRYSDLYLITFTLAKIVKIFFLLVPACSLNQNISVQSRTIGPAKKSTSKESCHFEGAERLRNLCFDLGGEILDSSLSSE